MDKGNYIVQYAYFIVYIVKVYFIDPTFVWGLVRALLKCLSTNFTSKADMCFM